MGYEGDSFFTLTGPEQVGLALLSLSLWAAMLALCAWPRLRRWLAVLRAVGLFWAFVWLSPQVYYLYYLTIFDGLPWQVVVHRPPGVEHLLGLLTFTGEASLSRHGQGVLGCSMLVLAVSRPRSPGSGRRS